MSIGCEWLIDGFGCRPAVLCDPDALRRVCDEIVSSLQLHVVGEPVWHRFPPPGGVTGMYLLSESHLTCHTYPEHGLATFNLYCCRPRPQWSWEERLSDLLGADSVTVRCIPRGADGRTRASMAAEQGRDEA